MLKETVSKELVKQFGEAVRVNSENAEFAVFAAKDSDVGGVTIEEDGNELIVRIGEITHGHFGSYETELTQDEHAASIAEDVIKFLIELFDDDVLLFKSANSGGWARHDMIKPSDILSPNTEWYKWSGPVNIASS